MAKQFEAYNLRRVNNGFVVTKNSYYYGPEEDFVFSTWTEALKFLADNEPAEIKDPEDNEAGPL